MAATLNPYLSFVDTTRAAMEFYQSVFGGDLEMNTFGEYGAEGPEADRIMHAQLTTPEGFTLMASDVTGDMPAPTSGSAMTVSLSGDDEKLRDYWAALADGGTVTMPFEKQMWGDEFGMVTDKFGVPWMVDLVASGQESATE